MRVGAVAGWKEIFLAIYDLLDEFAVHFVKAKWHYVRTVFSESTVDVLSLTAVHLEGRLCTGHRYWGIWC